MCTFISMFVIGLVWFNDILISCITAFILAHVVMTYLKNDTRRYLTGLNDALEDFLLAYYKSSNNIDEAFYVVVKPATKTRSQSILP